MLEFAALFLDPRIKSDMLFLGDNWLYWRSIVDTVKKKIATLTC